MDQMQGLRTDVNVQFINKGSREVMLEDGQILKMTQLHAVNGEETDDMEEAAFATVELPDGKWIPVIFAEYEEAGTTH